MNDSASGASAGERDSMYKDDNDDSDFDEATFNNNFNGVVRDLIPSPNVPSTATANAANNNSTSSSKFNGNSKLDVDDNFDSISEQSRHSEWVIKLIHHRQTLAQTKLTN